MKTKTTRFASPLFGSLLLMFALLATPVAASAAVYLSVAIAPPALPVYVQPPVPGPGYIWTPGYWAYGPDGYYWVPGTWVLAPYVGALWTPGYWGWGSGAYFWHGGYWGPHVGYYGGINYGFGYVGVGYHGGSWNGGVFSYNSAVTNVNVTNIHNTYNQPVVQNTVAVTGELQRRGRRHCRPAHGRGASGRERQPSPGDAAADKTPAARQHQSGPVRVGEPRYAVAGGHAAGGCVQTGKRRRRRSRASPEHGASAPRSDDAERLPSAGLRAKCAAPAGPAASAGSSRIRRGIRSRSTRNDAS